MKQPLREPLATSGPQRTLAPVLSRCPECNPSRASVCTGLQGQGEGRSPDGVSEGHSALRFSLWVGQEKRSLGVSGGAMGQQTFTSLCFGEGPAAAGWGSRQHGTLSKAWKNFSARHTQRLQPPKTAPAEQLFPGDSPSWAQISSGGKTTVRAPPTFVSGTADPCPGVLGFPSGLFSPLLPLDQTPGTWTEEGVGSGKNEVIEVLEPR